MTPARAELAYRSVRELQAQHVGEHAEGGVGIAVAGGGGHQAATTEQAWADAEAKVAEMAQGNHFAGDTHRRTAVGQRRLLDLAARGEVLDDNLYTAPGRHGGGGAGTTWLVGSAEDVAGSLRKYENLGITHLVLSATPYLREIERQGERVDLRSPVVPHGRQMRDQRPFHQIAELVRNDLNLGSHGLILYKTYRLGALSEASAPRTGGRPSRSRPR